MTIRAIMFYICVFTNINAQNFIRVTFEDVFKGESVSMYVNEIQIFKNQKLYNSKSVSTDTGFSILFTRINSGKYYITQFYPFNVNHPYSKKKIYKYKNNIDTHEYLELDKKNPYLWMFRIEMDDGRVLKKEIDISKGAYLDVSTFDGNFEEGLFIMQYDFAFD